MKTLVGEIDGPGEMEAAGERDGTGDTDAPGESDAEAAGEEELDGVGRAVWDSPPWTKSWGVGPRIHFIAMQKGGPEQIKTKTLLSGH